ncbi:TetR/AcrR family transcriptional regulator [Sphingomonas sp. C8-2]|jgi:AcrR family transcriptional regulator|uniref:TetR/AcrR family transcriptional regulator n=1 Tax=Rhizorhabdus histidinilytica TaxID=439228 RepID=UPI000F77BAC7|nr:TetR/AcrR family transcriptional regulator [Sphingomonas sp. C8-2]
MTVEAGRPVAMQARGRKRREALLAAARQLLAERESSQITLADIAARAEVSKSSAYHFYTDAIELFVELVSLLDGEFQQAIARPVAQVADWEELMGIVIDRAAGYFEDNPAAQQLMLSSQTPPAIKRYSRRADVDTSRLIENLIDAHFVLPDLPDRSRIFFYAIEAADLMFGLSLFERGALLREMVDEAKRMSCAYLGLYIPRHLPRREGAGD